MARLGRDNHLINLINRLPALTVIYGLQCLIVYKFISNINIGDFALYLSLFLVTFVCSLYVYNRHHHVLLYKNHLLLFFQPLSVSRKIKYSDIVEVIAPEVEREFASILLKLRSEETVALHFVDYPVQVQSVINELIQDSMTDQTEKFDLTA